MRSRCSTSTCAVRSRRLSSPTTEKAERLVEAFRTLLPTVTTLVAHHFRSVLLEVAQEHLEAVGDATELAAARNEPSWERARIVMARTATRRFVARG